MKLNSKILGIIILVVFFGGIAAASALGWWQTEGGGGGGEGKGSGSGEITTETIRGRTTFQEALNLGISQDVIEMVIGGPIPDPAMRIKIYCDENGLDFETVKENLQTEIDKLNSGD